MEETVTVVENNQSFVPVGNFTEDDVKFEEWILHVYFGFVSIGGLLDAVYVLGLMRCRRSGILSLVMQLCAIDIATVCLASIEILSLNGATWSFPLDLCPMYNGFEILLNSLTLWLIVCLNFQTVSLWNLQKKESTRKTRNPLTSCGDESDECLVTKRENARVMNIDYRKRKDDVSVIIPAILIWFFCVSLSIPNFTLSMVMKMESGVKICTLIDNYYGHVLQLLLLVFKAILPLPLLIFSFVIVAVKMVKSMNKNFIDNSTKDFLEIRALLVYCLSLSLCYFMTSFQRNVFYAIHMVQHNLSEGVNNVFKFPPLYNNLLSERGAIALTMLHYGGIVLRAVLCVSFLPKFKELIRSKVFVCCKSDK